MFFSDHPTTSYLQCSFLFTEGLLVYGNTYLHSHKRVVSVVLHCKQRRLTYYTLLRIETPPPLFTSLMAYHSKVWDPQNGSGISYSDYKNLYPLHYFDFTAQDSGLFSRGTAADLEVRYKMSGPTTDTYHLVVVLESETGVEFTPIAENRVKLVQM